MGINEKRSSPWTYSLDSEYRVAERYEDAVGDPAKPWTRCIGAKPSHALGK
jgi:hypothetical protein